MDEIIKNFQRLNIKNEEIKSSSFIDFSSVSGPADFCFLGKFTDLNLLQSNSLDTENECLQNFISSPSRTDCFSSFQLAHKYLDYVGKVDFISDAESIKHLLKIEHCDEPVSMIVHKIGNTFLIDEFDFQKNVLKGADNWKWLKNYYYASAGKSNNIQDNCFIHKTNNLDELQEKNLYIKLLRHSISNSLNYNSNNHVQNQNFPSSSVHSIPPLPEPIMEFKFPNGPETQQLFKQNLMWNFRQVQMILGSDTQIFKNSTNTKLLLRLRNMSKPLDQSTIIDYWLDCLMCSIPSVVMCNHLNGVIHTYDFIKTENLQYLNEIGFSPASIGKLAKKTLSFLKSNATDIGHTYWVFNDSHKDSTLRICDLTVLCSELEEECETNNPFAVPIAMLLYSVACNIKYKKDVNGTFCSSFTIYSLLNSCIQLLDKTRHPQIFASINYMLSDLYIPMYTNPTIPKLEDLTNTGEYSLLFDDDLSEFSQITLKERCYKSLNYFNSGVISLNYFDNADSKLISEKEMNVEKELRMPNQKKKHDQHVSHCTSKKIKCNKIMIVEDTKDDYGNNKFLKTLLDKSVTETKSTWLNKPYDQYSILWKDHLKTLFYEKACLIFAVLAEYEIKCSNYIYAFNCFRTLFVFRLSITGNNDILGYILRHCGDCCMMVAHKWKMGEEYKWTEKKNLFCLIVEKIYLEELKKFIPKNNYIADINLIPTVFRTMNAAYIKAENCYRRSLQLQTTKTNIIYLSQRIGHIYNHIVSNHLSEIWAATQNTIKSALNIDELTEQCENYLLKGIEIFQNVNDKSKVAQTFANKAHLYRHVSYFLFKFRIGEFQLHINYMHKAVENYKISLTKLGSRCCDPQLWDDIRWSLCTATYDMALQYENNPSFKKDRVKSENEFISLFLTALKYCHYKDNVDRKLFYEYRSAYIHNRIGIVYHQSLWYNLYDKKSDSTFKKTYQQSTSHYDHAFKFFLKIHCAWECLEVLLQKIELEDFQISSADLSLQSKLQIFISIKTIFKKCIDVVKLILKSNRGECKLPNLIDGHSFELLEIIVDDTEQNRMNTRQKHLNALEKHLCTFLKNLIDVGSQKISRALTDNMDQLKAIYDRLKNNNEDIINCLHLLKSLTQISKLNLKV